MENLKNRVAIITGASSGIGAGTAIYLAKLQAKVVLVGRNETNLRNVANDCTKNNSQNLPLIIAADITVEADIEKIIRLTIEHYGRIDILINNAGVLATGSIENTNMEQYDHIMNTNVRSLYYLTMLAVPYLIETKGNIVNVSSVNGIRAFPGVLAYCMSKAAVDQFTRCIALELGTKGVRVNSINPGVILTNIHKRGGMTDEVYEKFLEHSRSTHALGRAGIVEEVAKSIAFLVSDSATFVTGVSLPVDGGRHAMVAQND